MLHSHDGTRSAAETVATCRTQLGSFGLFIWHNFGTLTASKRHQTARPCITKSLCLQVVGCACWCAARTFKPLVDGSIPLVGFEVREARSELPWPCTGDAAGRRSG